MTADTIMGRLAKIIRSDEGITLSESFRIHVGVRQVEDMRGTNSQECFFHNLDPNDDFNCVFRRKYVVRMNNTDNLCVAHSLCIIHAKLKGVETNIKIL